MIESPTPNRPWGTAADAVAAAARRRPTPKATAAARARRRGVRDITIPFYDSFVVGLERRPDATAWLPVMRRDVRSSDSALL
jgi:hypothetical protein